MNKPLPNTVAGDGGAWEKMAALFSLRMLPWFAAACALALYASTAAPWLTWANDGADGGDLIAAAMVGGVPHPSGYPTYCLLSRLFALLPMGSIAHRFNLFSAVMAAGAVALFSLCAVQMLDAARDGPEPGEESKIQVIIALGAALAVACAPTLWSQATISEVYALNVFFFAALLYIALRVARGASTSAAAWGACGALLGIGLGNHLTLIFVLPALLILLSPVANRRHILASLIGLLVGLMVYIYLPLAARSDPPINWGNPRTWQGFWWVVSGQVYHGYAFSLPLHYLPSRLGAWLRLVADQYTLLGLALALNGLWSYFEKGPRRWAWATVLTFALLTLYALFYDTADSYVYLIPAHLLVALWIVEGARATLATLVTTRLRRVALLIVTGLLLFIPSWSLVKHLPQLDLSRDQHARLWAEQIEEALPPGALVITGEDAHTFTLHYVRWVENRRPDLLIVDGELLLQPWYVAQLPTPYQTFSHSTPQAQPPGNVALDTFIAANLPVRPVYLTNRRQSLEQRYQVEPRGPLLWAVTGIR